MKKTNEHSVLFYSNLLKAGDTYMDNFIKLLYNARVAEHTSAMLEESAYFMTRGILTLSGMKRFDYMFEKQALNLIFQ